MFTRSIINHYLHSLPVGLNSKNLLQSCIQIASFKDYPIPKKYDLELPPDTRGKRLPILLKVPQYPPQLKPFKMQRKLRLMRGPEQVHNDFIHKQYGIVALIGGRLKYGHTEMIRYSIVRKLNKKAFSLWRIDAPWQPCTKKAQGHQMGGGKAAIDHYVTPIKAGRVIIEVGGPIEWFEVQKTLEDIAAKLPFKAKACTYEQLCKMKEKEKWLEENNENPYTFKYVVQNNLGGCHNWISPIDKLYFGRHR